MLRHLSIAALLTTLALPAVAQTFTISSDKGGTLNAESLETFNSPWAMTWLPDGQGLVTEKGGTLWLIGPDGRKRGQVTGLPRIQPRGQGGFGDIVLHPDYAQNGMVYYSYVERGVENDSLSGAVVHRARLVLEASGGRLEGTERIWEQSPKVSGNGHYGHRIAFAPDGHLFITSGERQKFSPAQNMAMNLGKVLRLTDTGGIPADNPFVNQGGVTAQIWTLGHRNPLGMDFDAQGELWVHEMGPRHGDELNRIVRAENYGYPKVSDGRHYSGIPIPDHDTNPAYKAPAKSWVPAISPAGFIIYDGAAFLEWSGNGLIGGLSSRALVRVSFGEVSTDTPGRTEIMAQEVERYEWDSRVREVEQGSDGAIYVLEDGGGGRLLRLTPGG